ncbi:MAG: transglycosylase domain-containing protein [Alphaproteobacteria bacterium]|nr:transglycosylase domain-containing protein [Alphaproteobacteria bacterium]
MGLFDPFRRKPPEPEPAPHRGYFSLHDGLGEDPAYEEWDARLDEVDRRMAGEHAPGGTYRLQREPRDGERFWQRAYWRDRRKRWWAGRIVAAGLALFVLLVAGLAITAPLNKSLQPIAPPMVTLLAADGTPIARNGAVTDEPVVVSELPPHVVEAFMAIEDRRFYDHWGVDPRGVARAVFMGVGGGSTITQQLAKFTFLTPEQTLTRKAREMLIAFWLESWLTKDEILARYLSNAYFGDNVYGLRAASMHFFYRRPENLTVSQATMLAGLVQAPSRFNPVKHYDRAERRRQMVVDAMVAAGYLTEGEAQRLRPPALDVRLKSDLPTGTYFADWALPEARERTSGGYARQTLTTTLDSRLQSIARVVTGRPELGGAQVALVAMRPNGEVVAMIGGTDYGTSTFNRATQAQRQPGSTFKLFVYLAAFRAGMTPEDMIDDTPITTGSYRPANHGGKYRGRISLRQAFAASSNVAAVRLTQKVGVDNVIKVARDLGVTAPLTEDLSLALGTSEIPLIELAEAYAAVAAGSYPVLAHGLPPEERGWFERLMARQRAFDDDELAMIRDLLSSAANRGTGSAAALRTSTFGKTGTTQDSRDAIFVGYAGGLVTAVWIGNDDNSPLPGGAAGGGIPARIWRNFMSGAINEAVEDAPVETQDADLVNAIANISVETGIGNVGLGVDEGGMTVNVGPAQIRLPTDQPAPPADTAPPRIAPTQPPQGEDSGA